MISKLSKKIAIIGAGPAGLTAAETLKEKGYTNITLFEKDSTAGGKCCSMKYDGKWYELGAGIIVESNTVMWNLAKKFNIKTVMDFSWFEEVKTHTNVTPRSFQMNLFKKSLKQNWD